MLWVKVYNIQFRINSNGFCICSLHANRYISVAKMEGNQTKNIIFARKLKRLILIPDFFPNAETHYRTQFRNLIKLIIPHSSQQMKKWLNYLKKTNK